MTEAGAWEIADGLRQAWTYVREPYLNYPESIDHQTAGGSTEGQFGVTIGGRRFHVTVTELED